MFPEKCPTCGEPVARKWDKHPDQPRYRCGTTTMMLIEGFHFVNHNPPEEALYKQHLAKMGCTNGDPML